MTKEANIEKNALWFAEMAHLIVPYRDEQWASLLTLIPFGEQAEFKVVDVGCGDGRLGQCLLLLYPGATYVGLDGSPSIRAAASDRLAQFGARAVVSKFAIDTSLENALVDADTWRPLISNCDVVIASAFDIFDDNREDLFVALTSSMSDRGAMLIAESLASKRREANQIEASMFANAIEAQNKPYPERAETVADFQDRIHIFYERVVPNSRDPSLFDRLSRFSELGFVDVDCFWRRAGSAVYGGYRPNARGPGYLRWRFAKVLGAVREVLRESPIASSG